MAINTWDLTEDDFGALFPFIQDDEITDIDYNGTTLWINDIYNNRRQVTSITVTPEDMKNFAIRVSNRANKKFDPITNILEAQTNNLRISVLHDAITTTGISVCIRKSPPAIRLTPELAIKTNFCTEEIYSLIVNCVLTRMNFVFCGEPQVGKTEGVKLFSQYIPANQRVITIEDTPELHYHEINPTKDCVEMIIGNNLTYTDAIKACLRQNPKWIMLSEARSTEVKYLIEQWSTGVFGMTTLHTDDTRKIPDRIVNMSGSELKERIENDVYSYVNIGVLIKKRKDKNGNEYRYIDQVCFFTRTNGENKSTLIVKDGDRTSNKIPSEIMHKFKMAGIEDPFKSDIFILRDKENIENNI